jgi:hypothetical protein
MTDAYDSTMNRTNELTMIFLEKEFKTFKNFAPTWENWKEYLKKKKRPIKSLEQEKSAFQHLLNVSEKNLREAKKIIVQAKSGGYTNLIPLLGQKKKVSGNDFPDEWDSKFFKNLDPTQFSNYYKHLRDLGYTPVRHNGQIIKWAIPQPEKI